MNRKLFHLVGLNSKKLDILITKNQISNTLKFIQVWNKQIDLLKDLYCNKTLNANMVDPTTGRSSFLRRSDELDTI